MCVGRLVCVVSVLCVCVRPLSPVELCDVLSLSRGCVCVRTCADSMVVNSTHANRCELTPSPDSRTAHTSPHTLKYCARCCSVTCGCVQGLR